jgi:hypothetical protein
MVGCQAGSTARTTIVALKVLLMPVTRILRSSPLRAAFRLKEGERPEFDLDLDTADYRELGKVSADERAEDEALAATLNRSAGE